MVQGQTEQKKLNWTSIPRSNFRGITRRTQKAYLLFPTRPVDIRVLPPLVSVHWGFLTSLLLSQDCHFFPVCVCLHVCVGASERQTSIGAGDDGNTDLPFAITTPTKDWKCLLRSKIATCAIALHHYIWEEWTAKEDDLVSQQGRQSHQRESQNHSSPFADETVRWRALTLGDGVWIYV